MNKLLNEHKCGSFTAMFLLNLKFQTRTPLFWDTLNSLSTRMETRKIGTLKRTCVYCDLGLIRIEMNLNLQKRLNDLLLK